MMFSRPISHASSTNDALDGGETMNVREMAIAYEAHASMAMATTTPATTTTTNTAHSAVATGAAVPVRDLIMRFERQQGPLDVRMERSEAPRRITRRRTCFGVFGVAPGVDDATGDYHIDVDVEQHGDEDGDGDAQGELDDDEMAMAIPHEAICEEIVAVVQDDITSEDECWDEHEAHEEMNEEDGTVYSQSVKEEINPNGAEGNVAQYTLAYSAMDVDGDDQENYDQEEEGQEQDAPENDEQNVDDAREEEEREEEANQAEGEAVGGEEVEGQDTISTVEKKKNETAKDKDANDDQETETETETEDEIDKEEMDQHTTTASSPAAVGVDVHFHLDMWLAVWRFVCWFSAIGMKLIIKSSGACGYIILTMRVAVALWLLPGLQLVARGIFTSGAAAFATFTNAIRAGAMYSKNAVVMAGRVTMDWMVWLYTIHVSRTVTKWFQTLAAVITWTIQQLGGGYNAVATTCVAMMNDTLVVLWVIADVACLATVLLIPAVRAMILRKWCEMVDTSAMAAHHIMAFVSEYGPKVSKKVADWIQTAVTAYAKHTARLNRETVEMGAGDMDEAFEHDGNQQHVDIHPVVIVMHGPAQPQEPPLQQREMVDMDVQVAVQVMAMDVQYQLQQHQQEEAVHEDHGGNAIPPNADEAIAAAAATVVGVRNIPNNNNNRGHVDEPPHEVADQAPTPAPAPVAAVSNANAAPRPARGQDRVVERRRQAQFRRINLQQDARYMNYEETGSSYSKRLLDARERRAALANLAKTKA